VWIDSKAFGEVRSSRAQGLDPPSACSAILIVAILEEGAAVGAAHDLRTVVLMAVASGGCARSLCSAFPLGIVQAQATMAARDARCISRTSMGCMPAARMAVMPRSVSFECATVLRCHADASRGLQEDVRAGLPEHLFRGDDGLEESAHA